MPDTAYIEGSPEVMSNLKHENIIKYFDHFQYNVLLCMVFEYCEVNNKF